MKMNFNYHCESTGEDITIAIDHYRAREEVRIIDQRTTMDVAIEHNHPERRDVAIDTALAIIEILTKENTQP